MRRLIVLAAVLALSVGLLAGCGGAAMSAGSSAKSTTTLATTTTGPKKSSAGLAFYQHQYLALTDPYDDQAPSLLKRHDYKPLVPILIKLEAGLISDHWPAADKSDIRALAQYLATMATDLSLHEVPAAAAASRAGEAKASVILAELHLKSNILSTTPATTAAAVTTTVPPPTTTTTLPPPITTQTFSPCVVSGLVKGLALAKHSVFVPIYLGRYSQDRLVCAQANETEWGLFSGVLPNGDSEYALFADQDHGWQLVTWTTNSVSYCTFPSTGGIPVYVMGQLLDAMGIGPSAYGACPWQQ